MAVRPEGKSPRRSPQAVPQKGPSRRDQKLGPCPVCGKPVEPENPSRPFCRDRCKMVDLGRWFRGEYVVAGEDAIDMDPEQFEEGLRDLKRRADEEAAADEGGDPEREA